MTRPSPIRKAIIPVAGFGTRFLPATKAMPKEMLPIIDKPLAQFVVDEALDAGIDTIVFITGRGKTTIENHFDHSFELTEHLKRKQKLDVAADLERLELKAGQFAFVRQKSPAGLGDAILRAREFVGDEPFAVLLPDIIVDAKPGCMRQLVDAYEKNPGVYIATDRVPMAEVNKYGVVSLGKKQTPTENASSENTVSENTGPENAMVQPINALVEKPPVDEAPSNLKITGRYILPSKVFDLLATLQPGADGEIQLTDSIAALLGEFPLFSHEFSGRTFDCGSKRGYFEATLHFARSHPALAEHFDSVIDQYR